MEESTWSKRWHEGLRGARVVSPLSHIFCEFSQDLVGCLFLVLLVSVVLWLGVCLLSFWDGLVKFCTQLASDHFESPVVDRLCFALARQCRKKISSLGRIVARVLRSFGETSLQEIPGFCFRIASHRLSCFATWTCQGVHDILKSGSNG